MIYCTSISKALVPPLAKIIQEGSDEGIFMIGHAEDVADIIVRLMSSYINSAYYEEYQENEIRRSQYFNTIVESINRIIGTHKHLKIFQ